MICNGTTVTGKPCKLKALAGTRFCKKHQFSTIVVSVRCKAIGRDGNRCKHKTIRGELCWQHLKKEKGLRIKKSDIPAAGMGLFAAKPFPEGAVVAPYTGDTIVSHDKKFGDNYTLQIKKRPPTYISARRSNTGEGRYANDKRGGRDNNNSDLLYNTRTRKAYLKATDDIATGDEISTVYGNAYWRAVNRR